MKPSKKIPGSWKFIAVATIVLLAVPAGLWINRTVSLSGYTVTPELPGSINLVAIQPGRGYRVIVANRIAQLGEVDESAEDGGFGGVRSEDAQNLRRIPVKEVLGSLGGDPSDLGKLIERMNDLLPPDEPVSPFVWKAEDLKKALAGDKALLSRLELDLQVRLDGSPINQFSVTRIMNGIVIDTPVPVTVNVKGKPTQVMARVRQRYQPRLAAAVEKDINQKFNPSPDQLMAIYTTHAKDSTDPGKKEDVRKSLESRLTESRLTELKEKPERIVASAMVLANENQFAGAESRSYQTSQGKELTDLTIRLTDEGRKRLWKYSSEKKGFQLMLIVDGVAIAAPRITTELAESSVKITQMPDRQLAEDAVKDMNRLGEEGSNKVQTARRD